MNKAQGSEKKNGFADAVSEFITHTGRKLRSVVRGSAIRMRSSAVFKFFAKPGTVEKILEFIKCASLCAVSFLFGRCDFGFGVYPLGFTMLICQGRLTFFSYMGSAIAALTYERYAFAFFGVNTLIYIIRKILLSESFCESRKTRTFLALGSGIFISGALILTEFTKGVFPSLDADIIFRCLMYTLTLPLFVYLLYPLTASEKFPVSSLRTSLVLFCAFITLSANFTFGENLSIFLACAFCLFFCTYYGDALGMVSGALLGFSTLNFPFAAPLCISAFVFTKLYEKKRPLAYAGFLSALCLLCLAVMDFSTQSADVFISVLIATLVFIPAGAFISSKRAEKIIASPCINDTVSDAYNKRMSTLSSAFSSVSNLCFGFSNRLKFPGPDEAAAIVSMVSAKRCASCTFTQSCKYKRLYVSPEIPKHLCSGRLSVGKFPERLKLSCPNLIRIAEEINDEYKKVLSERFNNNKTEILAYEYSTLARILKYTSKISSEDVFYDAPLTHTAICATRKLGLPNTAVTVYGSRRKVLDVCGVPVSAVNMPSENLATYYSSQCGVVFDTPEFILDDNNTFTMRMKSKEVIAVEYVKAVHTKNGETVSGDTVSFFRSDDSFFYALIADGMGSGRDAAMTSRITAVFVEKLLSGGAGKGVTMELLNSLIMSKNKECFSSVDLLELDLLLKRASFVKAGAAPAYILRSAKLFKVSSDTPPCGIIEGFSAENTSFEVFSGDVIIMLSDGITSSIDCGSTLCDIMNKHRGAPPETIAGKILDAAVSMSVHDDDMSCVLVRIK